MNDKKLDDLVRKGLDERTPDAEALACLRIAAKHFSDAKPSTPNPDQLGQLEAERDKAKADADKLRLIIQKMLALDEAETKLDKAKADLTREAKAAVGRQEPAKPFRVEDWIRNEYVNPTYKPF